MRTLLQTDQLSTFKMWACLVLFIGCQSWMTSADIGVISGYPQVDVDQLSPFSMSWNQVHYLVRESLLEIDQLRQMQDEFYQELHDCFGLEGCLKEGDLMDGPPQTGGQLGAGALLASLRAERQNLKSRHSNLASNLDDIRTAAAAAGGRGSVARGGVHTVSSSSSFRSSRTRGGGGGGSGGLPPAASGSSGSSRSSYSYSYSSSSSSSSRGRQSIGDNDDYDYNEGPVPTRG